MICWCQSNCVIRSHPSMYDIDGKTDLNIWYFLNKIRLPDFSEVFL